MENEKLKVRMLGAFTMEYGNRPISFERNTVTKTNQLMQILLHAGDKGVSRANLLERLFAREEVTNPSNSLRATVFRLRKLLAETGLFGEEEFIHIKSGIYRFTSAIPVELDTVLFENTAKEALSASDEAVCYSKLEDACALYQGDFLPMLCEEAWVVEEAAKYKKLYAQCMKKLCQLLKERKDFDRLYEVAAVAVALYPYDEWQIWQIDSLIARNQAKEAMRLYEETADMLFRNKGLSPSEKFAERLAQMSGIAEEREKVIEEIQEELGENEELKGAFYCSYPSFAETYRYIKRVISRSGQSAYLVLCTVTDGKGYPLKKGERMERLSEEVGEAIRGALRRGDLYTKYSTNQYLVLLFDIKLSDCQAVIDRINGNFEKPYRKNYLKYHIKNIWK